MPFGIDALLSLPEFHFVKTITKAHLAVLGTNFFFAVNFTLIKIISPLLMGPDAVNIFRVGISIFLFWLLWLFSKKNVAIQRKHWGRILLCAVTGIGLNQTFFIKGLTMTSAIHASLLALATPILVSFFALWALNEKFTLTKGLGLLLGICGSVFLVLQKENSLQASDYFFGDMLILVNAIFYSVYFISVKPLMETYSALHVIRWVFTIGFVLLLPIGWKEMQQIQWTQFNWKYIAIIMAVAVGGTFLAYLFNAYALQHLSASTAGTYIYTQPVFAVLIAVLFLNESFSWQKAVSALLIFCGVYLVSFRKKVSVNSAA